MSLGPAEILVILLIALLVFGPKRLPEVGRQVGRAARELRKFQQSLRSDLDEVFTVDASDQAAPPPSLPPKAVDDLADAAAHEDETTPPSDEVTPPPGPPEATA